MDNFNYFNTFSLLIISYKHLSSVINNPLHALLKYSFVCRPEADSQTGAWRPTAQTLEQCKCAHQSASRAAGRANTRVLRSCRWDMAPCGPRRPERLAMLRCPHRCVG